MKIPVEIERSCTWVLDGDEFYCSHDEVDIVEYETMTMSNDGAVEHTSKAFACIECGEVTGYPDEGCCE